METSLTRVMVIEDEKEILESLEYFLEGNSEFMLVGKYTNPFKALTDFHRIDPDIVITDISMPGLNGIELLKRFKKIKPKIFVLVISVHDDLTRIMNAIQNEADGYLSKPIKKEDLITALKSVGKGGVPLSDNIAKKVVGTFRQKKLDLFSERENEVIEQLRKGLSYKDISTRLFISESTVNYHLQNIYTKLNVNSKSEALKKLNNTYFN